MVSYQRKASLLKRIKSLEICVLCKTCFFRLLENKRGEVAIEYGLIAALIALLIIAVVPLIGASVIGFFQSAVDGLQTPP